MAKFRLAFGLHNHQPVGNFPGVFEEAHQKAYAPFVSLLERFPGLSLSLHQSGILWRWQEENHREYLELVHRLAGRGQLELLTGGFYEPILTAIPEVDALGQIAMLTAYLKERFAVAPAGLWLTERIWEPHLPKLLARAHVQFLPVDDTHFIYAGLEQEQLTGPFVTEHEGYQVVLLPIQKRLRYLIPFGTSEEVMAELKRQADRNPSGQAVYADDGEKFGVWPQTHEHCYRNKWLPKFFEALAKNDDWLEVVSLGTIAAAESAGRAYLPSASYAEMLHWSLPPKAYVEYEELEQWLKKKKKWQRYSRFVRGGHWRGFLAKYEESNLMHKKMLGVSRKLARCEIEHADRVDQLSAARERLYAGQCNCPYWHGVFGGLYLPHIRQAVYENLIDADARLDQLQKRPGISIDVTDFDADGHDEIVCSGEVYSAVFRPRRGGTLLHLALNRHRFDVTDTLTRRREGYHLKLDHARAPRASDETASIHDLVMAKEDGLKDLIVEDWYLKRCFIDHFFTGDVGLDQFRSGRYGEEGDFILEPFTYDLKTNPPQITFSRDGHLWRPEGMVPIRVRKCFVFEDGADSVQISYELSARDNQRVGVNFGLENNFNFQSGHSPDRFIMIDGRRHEESFLDSVGRFEPAGSYAVVDQYRDLAVALVSDRLAEVWHLPIHTVSLSEGGFEKVYQGTTLVMVYRVELSLRPVVIKLSLHAGAYAAVNSKVSQFAALTSPR